MELETSTKLCPELHTMTDGANFLRRLSFDVICSCDWCEATTCDELIVEMLLKRIHGSLQAGDRNTIYVLPKIMEEQGTPATVKLACTIKDQLNSKRE